MQTNGAFLYILNVFLFIYLKICSFLVQLIVLFYCHIVMIISSQGHCTEPFVDIGQNAYCSLDIYLQFAVASRYA